MNRSSATIIGAGFIGEVHARALRLLGVDLVGVLDSDPERSQVAARRFGAERAFRNAEEAIGDPRVDAVHICTPNASHRPLVELAIDAGKHVICEKPLGLNVEEAEHLTGLARSANVETAVPFVHRYHPMARELRSRATGGELGRLLLAHGSYLQDWMLSPMAGGWRAVAEVGGASRAFADIGSHWCDLLEWSTGQHVTELVSLVETVITHRIRGSNRTFEAFGSDASAELVPVSNEDVAFAIFRMSEGLVGQLTVSQVSAGRKNKLRVEIDGSEAGAIFDTEHPELLWISRSERSELLMRNGPALSPDAQRFSTLPAGHAQGFVDCFVGLFSDFYSTILGEQPPRHPTFEDGRRVATIADSVLASAANHSWVKVEP